MKKSLLLYLFIIAVLMNIFTYMYFSKKTSADRASCADEIKKKTDSLNLVKNQLDDAAYFSFGKDQNAQNYIVDKNIDKIIPMDRMEAYVTQKLIDQNDNPAGNPYTGQPQLGAQKFIINKAKMLNHRWIIADYSDSKYWGEALIKYFINDDKTVSFEVIQTFLYQ